jgi:hypothetical protein
MVTITCPIFITDMDMRNKVSKMFFETKPTHPREEADREIIKHEPCD